MNTIENHIFTVTDTISVVLFISVLVVSGILAWLFARSAQNAKKTEERGERDCPFNDYIGSEVETLKKKGEALEQKLGYSDKEIENYKQELEQLHKELNVENERRENSSSEREQLLELLREVFNEGLEKPAGSFSEEFDTFKKRFQNLLVVKGENSILKGRISDMEKALAVYRRHEDDMSRIFEKNEKRLNKGASVFEKLSFMWQGRGVKKANADKEKLGIELFAIEEENEKLLEKIDVMENNYRRLQSIEKRLLSEIDDLLEGSNESVDLNNEVNKLENINEELGNRVASLASEVETLVSEKNEKQEELEELLVFVGENEWLIKTVASKDAEIEKLKLQYNSDVTDDEELGKEREEFVETQCENIELKAQIETLSSDLEKIRADETYMLEEMDRLEGISAENKKLNKTIDDQETVINELKMQVKTDDNDVEELRKDMEEFVETQRENESLKDKLATTQNEVLNLQKKIQDYEEESSIMAYEVDHLTSIDGENTELKRRLKELEEEREEAERNFQAMKTDQETTMKDAAGNALEEELASTRKVNSELKRKVMVAGEEFKMVQNDLKVKSAKFRKELEDLRGENSSLRDAQISELEVRSLKNKLAEKDKEVESMFNEINSFAGLEQENIMLKKELEQFKQAS